ISQLDDLIALALSIPCCSTAVSAPFRDYLCVVPVLVVKSRGAAPRAMFEAVHDERAHALDVLGGWTAIRRTHHGGPGAVEADVRADAQREAVAARFGELRTEEHRSELQAREHVV